MLFVVFFVVTKNYNVVQFEKPNNQKRPKTTFFPGFDRGAGREVEELAENKRSIKSMMTITMIKCPYFYVKMSSSHVITNHHQNMSQLKGQ